MYLIYCTTHRNQNVPVAVTVLISDVGAITQAWPPGIEYVDTDTFAGIWNW